MKKYILLFFAQFLLLASCTDHKEDLSEVNDKKDQKTGTTIVDTNNTDHPSNELIRLVKFIDSSGYHSDTSLSYEKKNIGTLVFYRMKFEETPIFMHRDPSAYVSGADYCALNIKAFNNCQRIWSYSFIKNGTNANDRFAPVTGGFIEEFDFPDQESTSNALKEVDRKKSLIFYHTHSFCCSIRNSVFVFNTTPGGFDAALKEFFDEFIKDPKTKIPHNTPCYEDEYSK